MRMILCGAQYLKKNIRMKKHDVRGKQRTQVHCARRVAIAAVSERAREREGESGLRFALPRNKHSEFALKPTRPSELTAARHCSLLLCLYLQIQSFLLANNNCALYLANLVKEFDNIKHVLPQLRATLSNILNF